MQTSSKFGSPHNLDVTIRVAIDKDEVRQADELVFRNYVQDGFWENDRDTLKTNKFLRTPERTVFVATSSKALLATLSIVNDSAIGLPSDGTQSILMQYLRRRSGRIAEVSAFAAERSRTANRNLVCLLMSYMYQYSFYHVGIDRLVASCKPSHARFYESVLCFSKVSDLTFYQYSQASGYLVSLDLLEAHRLVFDRYPPDPTTGDSFYHVMSRPQPGQLFPDGPLARSRAVDWLELSTRRAA